MKYLFNLAFKNVLRYKRRTILTFSILTFGIMLYVFMAGLLQGFDNQSFRNQISFETGDFKIRSLLYDEDSPFSISNYIQSYSEVGAFLKSRPYVKNFTPLVKFQGVLDNLIIDRPVIAVGIDPATIDSVFTFSNFIYRGGFQQDGAVLGKTIASDMGLQIGDLVNITFRNAQNAYDSVQLTVSGLIDSPDPSVNNATVYINIEDAKRILNSDAVTEIAVKTADFRLYKTYSPDLTAGLKNYRVYDWNKLGEGFMAVGKAKKQAAGFFLFIIAIIALVGIVNTLLISIYEKRKEIGMLKALGMKDGEVTAMFVMEGFLIGLLGSITGIIAGILLNLYFVMAGINVSAVFGNMNVGWQVMGIVKSEWDVGSMVQAFVVSIVISIAASYYPSRKTAKMQPAECLRVI